MTRVIHHLTLGILLFGTLGCGPSYQPSSGDTPQPNATQRPPDNVATQPTLGLTRTEVPDNDPYYQPPASTQPVPYEESRPVAPPFRPPPQTRPPQQPTTRPQPPAVTQPPPRATNGLAPRYQEMLNSHNRHRANHCAAPLQWSSTLAAQAQGWADKLKQAGCAFEHSQNSPYGENLYFFAPAGNMSPEQISTGWYDEVQLYDFNNGAFSMSTGHFTQLVWKDTKNLGCGVSMCNGGEIWVCNYDPPGNVRGYYQRKVLPNSCQ